VNGEEGTVTVAMIVAAERSAATGEAVAVEPRNAVVARTG
jgi:hypothetical protein